MQPTVAFLAIRPVTENTRYNHELAIHTPLRIKVEVNQRDYNAGGNTMRYRCKFPDGQIMWVPLDALKDERGADVADTYFDEKHP